MTRRLAFLVTSQMTATHFLPGYVRHLSDRGWEVDVVTRSEDDLEGWASRLGVTGTAIPFVREPSPLADLRCLWQLWAHLRRTKPDIVVAATPKASLLGMIAATAARIPRRVYLAWGLRMETSRGPARLVFGAMERLTVALSTRCYANSPSLARRMEELHVAPVGKVEVPGLGSSHGVDLERFQPGAGGPVDSETQAFLDTHHAALTVVFVGRLNPDKGIDTLLDALDRCLEAGTSIRLLVVGPDEGGQAEAPNPRVAAVTHLAGQRADVRPYLAAADVLCLPSRREGFPNVVLEAAAMGKPAVVSDATGCVDSVVAGETGLIFGVGDAESLSQKFTYFAAEPRRATQMGELARRFVGANFEQRRVWEIYADRFDKTNA